MSSSPEEVMEAENVADTVVDSSSSSHNFYLVVAVVGALAAAAYYFLVLKKQDDGKRKLNKDVDVDDAMATNSVGLKDITYIASKLSPASTHLDILLAVASSPESIAWGTKAYLRREKLKEDRIQEEKKEEEERKKKESSSKKSSSGSNMFDLDDDGWADDDDEMDDEAKEKAKLAKEAEEKKQKEREQLKKATGKTKVPLEGLDEGVIGQKWVESSLEKSGAWPPSDLRFLKDETFEFEGKKLSALEHPGLRRNLCHIAGRINSIALNSHPDLLEAASEQKLDQTYFKASMEFRQRCGILLEATLRTALGFRNYPLAKTIVETVGIFKIGTKSPDEIEWFGGVMQKQYGTLPRIEIENTTLENPKEKEMATGDILVISTDLTRVHAEAFTRQKIAMCQKQGIPPQVALQTYREGWWYFVRAERLDGTTPASALPISTESGILSQVDKADTERFQTAKFEERLLTAWPMIVQNVAQKSGKVKIQFKAPPEPGKYKFTINVKSQDFLGADQEFSVEADIVDSETLDRKPKEEDTKEKEEDEGKKDK